MHQPRGGPGRSQENENERAESPGIWLAAVSEDPKFNTRTDPSARSQGLRGSCLANLTGHPGGSSLSPQDSVILLAVYPTAINKWK